MIICSIPSYSIPYISYDYSYNINMRYRALLFLILLYQNLKVFFPWSLTYMNSITVFSYLISERRQIRKAFLSSNNRMKLSLNNVPKPSLLAAVLRITNQLIYKDRLKDCCIVHILPAKWQLKFCLFCPFQGPVFKDDYTLIYFGGGTRFIFIIIAENIWPKMDTAALHFVSKVLVSEGVG